MEPFMNDQGLDKLGHWVGFAWAVWLSEGVDGRDAMNATNLLYHHCPRALERIERLTLFPDRGL